MRLGNGGHLETRPYFGGAVCGDWHLLMQHAGREWPEWLFTPERWTAGENDDGANGAAGVEESTCDFRSGRRPIIA
jgi:hypothetical protein